ncbi:DUF1824 family protein [Nodosilinea sp. P-1105]|uniref:DUF1824 family protein n=1 Tax=Nodosilinea sp. P-1105 TaxID=2546229 RepID=UPI00146E3D75|nr:DUF1824 family protein [Nodosilinea sp. P-1105]NMF83617.1 DUF1824 family protein [Nodosilinea sp. P-1105]
MSVIPPVPSQDQLSTIRQRLNRFSCLKTPAQLTPAEIDQVKADLQCFNEWSEYQTLGICADSLTEGKTAMESFLAALGVTVNLDLPERQGPIYLKFNTLKGAWYLDDYSGNSRGVLITFHTTEPDMAELVGTYGPLPLGLFSA